MNRGFWLPVLAVSGLLGGCGGGSGGDARPEIVPPPSPSAPPSPPPAEEPPSGPSSIHDLKANQTFTALAASSSVSIDRSSGEATSGVVSVGPLAVSYDVASKSYTVTASGYSSTFSPADIDEATTNNFVIYAKEGASSNEQIILLKTSLDGMTATTNVAMGMWQRNTLRPGETDMLFDMFVYGFEAPAAAVPRTGTGSFGIDVFGLTTSPGFEPKVFQGTGRFDVDFGVGIFSTWTNLHEIGILTGHSDSGTGFDLAGSGKLSGMDGTFSGSIIYGGAVGRMLGTLSGRFYGPDAREIGAIFFASDSGGSTVTGGMAGWWASDTASVNLTLSNLLRPELFFNDHAHMHAVTGEPTLGDSHLFLRPDGSLDFASSIPTLNSVTVTPESLAVSANPNFTAYEKIINGRAFRLEMYKSGQNNTELQLTYASFGQWQSAPQGGVLADGDRVFFAYGLRTPEGALTARTGSAHYEGVAYGAAFNTDTHIRYDVSGTSRFDVDFSNKSFSGGLTLAGTPASSATSVDFGTYQFGGSIDYMDRMFVGLQQGGSPVGRLQAGFYGPNGEEIAGSFEMTVPNSGSSGVTSITGATVATQR